MREAQDHSTLKWVRNELDSLVEQSRHALESYVDVPADKSSIEQCIANLHQIRGRLQMLQLYGAAMLAEEMELVAVSMRDDEIKRSGEAAEALMLGMVQLPEYLEKLEEGARDTPLLILPILNELRATRGEAQLSEVALFAPDLEQMLASEKVEGEANPQLPALARRIRLGYHKALLEWYRGTDVDHGFKGIREVLEKLEHHAGTKQIRRLFRVGMALTEVLREGGVKPGAVSKELYGRLDREIKRIIDSGEQEVASKPANDLLQNFLFYVACDNSENSLVKEVKKEFGLENTLISQAEIDREKEEFHAPGRELMSSVRSAIGPELTAIKDGIDLYLRDGTADIDRLDALEKPMRRIGDTLGMIGQGALRERLKRQAEKIEEFRESGEPPDEQTLMNMAGDILYVETSLENLSSAHHHLPIPKPAGAEGLQLPQGELEKLVDTVMREAEIDMARNKEAIISYLETPDDKSLLEGVPRRFKSISGAFRIMNLDKVSDLLESLAGCVVSQFQESDEVPPPERLNLFADALTSIEYFMQAISEGRGVQAEILMVAEDSLAQLAGQPAVASGETPSEADQPVESVSEEEPGEDVEVAIAASMEEPTAEETAQEELVQEEPAEEIDAEILEIFIEEARSEMGVIDTLLPRWIDNQGDRDALITLRRSFHTLKGSGRLVGALTLGEFSWSIENLLNRIIEETIQVSGAMLELMEQARGVLPGLIDCQESGRPPDTDLNPLMEQAFSLASSQESTVEVKVSEATEGEDEPEIFIEPEQVIEATESADVVPFPDKFAEAGTASETTAEPEESTGLLEELEAVPPPIVLEPELFEIFGAETRNHVNALREFVAGCRKKSKKCDMAGSGVPRALHTLHGSADMAGVMPVAEISGCLESLVNGMIEVDLRADDDLLVLMERSGNCFEAVLEVINVPGGVLPEWETLIEEIRQRQDSLPQPAEEESVPEPASALDAEPVFEDIDSDTELTEIFLEEARELLDSVETSLGHWEQNPSEGDAVAELKRTLHTLKGGARLAGAMPIGELSHAFESLLSEVGQSDASPTSEVFSLSRKVVDRLVDQLDDIEQGPRVRTCNDLLEDLEQLTGALPAAAGKPKSGTRDTGQEPKPKEKQEPEAAVTKAEEAPAPEIRKPEKQVEVEPAPTPAEAPLRAPDSAVAAAQQVQVKAKEESRPVRDQRRNKREIIRVHADALDGLVNDAGEMSIYGARLEQQNGNLGFNLSELEQTVTRLRNQLRQLEMETDAQILFRYERDKQEGKLEGSFDPLELDRFSTMQQLSRGLLETVSDLSSINGFLDDLRKETDTLLLQQSRVATDLQDGLLRTRMVPFAQLVPRLQRVVRQTATTLGKKVELSIRGAEGELDRGILDRMIGPVEHILRNAVSHGIESPESRRKSAKHKVGQISLDLTREGNDVVLTLSDDGAGLNATSIRKQAIALGLLDPTAELPDSDVLQFVLEHGFSTQSEVNQISGRGVGLDVVVKEVKQLGGSLDIRSNPGQGTAFIIRLPLTLAITDALVVEMGDEIYAIPHSSIEGVVRLGRDELLDCYEGRQAKFSYADHDYQVRYLGSMLNVNTPSLSEQRRWFPLLLVKAGEHRVALQIDSIQGNSQIVVRSVGPQIGTVRWIAGGTILGDGRVALILDVTALVRMDAAHKVPAAADQVDKLAAEKMIMVVDDSITVRKVTGRVLERNGMRVVTAKDGVDAVTQLQEFHPDLMLLDIEMPRMDGFELARHMRNSPDLKDIPIIMITSRTGDKHRKLAMEIGVKRYLGKPYQEAKLLESINGVLAGEPE